MVHEEGREFRDPMPNGVTGESSIESIPFQVLLIFCFYIIFSDLVLWILNDAWLFYEIGAKVLE